MRVPCGSSRRQGQQHEIRAFRPSKRTNFYERQRCFRCSRRRLRPASGRVPAPIRQKANHTGISSGRSGAGVTFKFPTDATADPRGMKRRDRSCLGRVRGARPSSRLVVSSERTRGAVTKSRSHDPKDSRGSMGLNSIRPRQTGSLRKVSGGSDR